MDLKSLTPTNLDVGSAAAALAAFAFWGLLALRRRRRKAEEGFDALTEQ
jgi:hypothetical protein